MALWSRGSDRVRMRAAGSARGRAESVVLAVLVRCEGSCLLAVVVVA
jgi:hypothetical protein